MTTAILWVAALLLLPLLALWHFTKSKPQRIREMRQRGWSWRAIADRYGVSQSTARRWAVG